MATNSLHHESVEATASASSIALAATNAFHAVELELIENNALLLLAQQSRDISEDERQAMGALWRLYERLLVDVEKSRARFEQLAEGAGVGGNVARFESLAGKSVDRPSMDTEHLDA